MDNVRSRKTLFVLVWGVLFWGGSTALTVTLVDWYTTHRIRPVYEIVLRFVIFMALGVWWGLFVWNKRAARGGVKLTRAGNILRLALFVALMVGLCYMLWALVHR